MTAATAVRRDNLTLSKTMRPVWEIKGDFKTWRYFTPNAALRRLALRKLQAKYPIHYYPENEQVGADPWETDLPWEQRSEIVSRFARRYRKALRAAADGGAK